MLSEQQLILHAVLNTCAQMQPFVQLSLHLMSVSLPLPSLLLPLLSLPSPQVITSEMKEFVLHLKEKAVIGIVGGSDLVKMEEQMGGDGGEGEG